jgi:hypothetical protein
VIWNAEQPVDHLAQDLGIEFLAEHLEPVTSQNSVVMIFRVRRSSAACRSGDRQPPQIRNPSGFSVRQASPTIISPSAGTFAASVRRE